MNAKLTPEEVSEIKRKRDLWKLTPEGRASEICGNRDWVHDTVGEPLIIDLSILQSRIAAAIKEAVEIERGSDLEHLLTAVIARINGEKSMETLAEYIGLNYPKQAKAIKL